MLLTSSLVFRSRLSFLNSIKEGVCVTFIKYIKKMNACLRCKYCLIKDLEGECNFSEILHIVCL